MMTTISNECVMPKILLQGSNHYIIGIKDKNWFFSYTTCVGFSSPSIRIRRESSYSKTTAKHMNLMSITNWKKVSDEEFKRLASL